MSPELFVAIIGSILILAIMGALSYATNNNTFIFVGLMTSLMSIPIAFHADKL